MKRVWRVILKSYRPCTMIDEFPIDGAEALFNARHRFFDDVVRVE